MSNAAPAKATLSKAGPLKVPPGRVPPVGNNYGGLTKIQRAVHETSDGPIQRECAKCGAEKTLKENPGIQPKLTVGPANDKFEQEADSMAEKVMRMPDPGPFKSQGPTGKNQVQAKGARGGAVSPKIANSIKSLRGGGTPLPKSSKAFFEPRFGQDFSKVRLHTDAKASEMADSIQARAFTLGNDIAFAKGAYNPESQSGKQLLAHELTHTVQQGGGIRTKDNKEPLQEKALARHTPSAAQPLSSSGRQVQRAFFGLGETFNSYARHVPGYTLITVLLGYNPLLDEHVPKTAENLVAGLLGLVPFGMVLFDRLKKSGALQEAFDWLSGEVTKLNISRKGILALLEQAWDEITLSEGLAYNIKVIINVFGPTVARIFNFAGAIGSKITELIFKGLLKLVGAPVKKFMELFNKGKEVLGKIFSDPIQFVKNLALAVKMGLDLFQANIKKHLISGLIGWIAGALDGTGITLPKQFNLKGIFFLIFQILGLTYERIRQKLVDRVGEKTVERIEKGVNFVTRLKNEGPIVLWEMIKEKISDLKNTIMNGIRDWVITKIIEEGITWLLGLLNPVGALLKIIKALYNIVMFFINRWDQITAFATSVFDSIGEIANGQLDKAAAYVERTIAKVVPVMIGFLASLLNLGGISEKIKEIIERIRKPVDQAVEGAMDWIINQGKALFGIGKKGEGEDIGEEEGGAATQMDGSIDDILAQPPTKSPRPVEVKKAELDQALSLVGRIQKETETTDEVEDFFPRLQKRFRLESIKYVDLGKPGARIQINQNPEGSMPDDSILQGDETTMKNPPKLKNTQPKYGGVMEYIDENENKNKKLIIGGTFMKVKVLGPGPELEEGSDTSSDKSLTPIMKKLPKRKFVKGHLLNAKLGGPGNEARNLFPITYSANSTHSTQIESFVKREVKDNKYWMTYTVKIENREVKEEPGGWLVNSILKAEAHYLDSKKNKKGAGKQVTIRSEMGVKGIDPAKKLKGTEKKAEADRLKGERGIRQGEDVTPL